jgi:sugar lactone lactonase YvrE
VDRREFLLGAAALALAPAARLGGRPLALVTADLEASVVAVDLSAGRVVRRLATPADPRSIESVGGVAALVAHTAEGRLTLIDSDLRVRPVRGELAEPRYAAVSPDRRHAYVTDSGRREVAVVDLRGRRVTGRVPVRGACRHLSIDRDGSRLWVVLGNSADEVAVLSLSDPARPRVVGRIRPPFRAHDVGFTPGGRRAWISSGDSRRLAIHGADGSLVRVLGGDAPPQHVTFAGGRAFVTSGDDAVLRVHALDGRLLRSAPVPAGSYNVQVSGDDPRARRWILTPSLSAGTLCAFDPRGAQVAELHVARSSHDACFLIGTS